jgi:vacuolar-type H+-ATPase subunit E/Vma4
MLEETQKLLPGRERALIEAARSELAHLREMEGDETGEIGGGDLQGALSRLSALVDLADVEAMELSAETKSALAKLDAEALQVMRSRATRRHQPLVTSVDANAARALFEAIMLNIPALAGGLDSGFAITISRQVFEELQHHCSDLPGFELVAQHVRVQDSRAMQLGGDLRR